VVRADAGRSLLELIIVVAMISLILQAGISRMSSAMYGAETSARDLTANLRLCRSQAVGSGYHYRVNVAAGSYAINRMVPGAGNAWVVDASMPTRTVTLPKSVTVSQGTGSYEFDSRGTTVGATLLSTVRLHDASTGNDVDVKVWPSGQVF
jgi:Tfp pilus assembly protein FimT